MIEKAKEAFKNSYSPYSLAKVGCSILSAKTGNIYTGCNVENSSYGATICAERSAISAAVSAEGDFGIAVIVIANNSDDYFTPCGICLQVISEFARSDTKVVLVKSGSNETKSYDFSELFPYAFSL